MRILDTSFEHTIPNWLSIFRIVASIALVLLFWMRSPGDLFQFEIIWVSAFVLACVSDFLDGKIARRFPSQASEFGKIIDPVADKVLVFSASAILILWGVIDVLEGVIITVITTREIAVTVLRKPFVGNSNRIAVSRVGKWKAGFQMVAFGLLLGRDGMLAGELNRLILTPALDFDGLGRLLLIIAGVLTLWSAWGYLLDYMKLAKQSTA